MKKNIASSLAAFFILAAPCLCNASEIRTLAKKAFIDPSVTVIVLSAHNPQNVRVFSESKTGMAVTIGPDRLRATACGISLVGDFIGARCGGAESQKYRSAVFEDLSGSVGIEIKGVVTRRYRGKIFIEADRNRLKIVNQLPLEQYLVSVVGNELESERNEAMKAQAVIARTVAYRNRNRHGTEDFCDLTHCQDYTGIEGETPRAAEAVKLTRGQTLVFNGRIAEVYYHSTCGGRTAPPNPAWGLRKLSGAPYLAGVDDGENCKASPHYRWTATFTPAQMRQLEIEGLQGALLGIEITMKSHEGRVEELEIRTSTGKQKMSGYDFYLLVGRTLGWNLVKSVYFDLSSSRGKVIIAGRGLGHGSGMCQWGAIGLAAKGYKYQKILYHYFPGTEVRVWQQEPLSRN